MRRRASRRVRRRHGPDRDPGGERRHRRDRRRFVGRDARRLPRRAALAASRSGSTCGSATSASRRSRSRPARHLSLPRVPPPALRGGAPPALRAATRCSSRGGRLVFDVFTPGREDIEETNGRWIEREPGIFERADWDEQQRTLTSRCAARRRDDDALAWVSARVARPPRARGFEVEACYGWFDRRPFAGGEYAFWIAQRPRIEWRHAVATASSSSSRSSSRPVLVALYNRLVRCATAPRTRGRRSTCS